MATKTVQSEIDFWATDSAEFVYYPNPENQKEYKTSWIKDTAVVLALAQNLAMPQKEIKECAHQIKMYLFSKGQVFKTVYAATDPQCNYLAMAVYSRPVFYPLTPELKTALNNIILNQ